MFDLEVSLCPYRKRIKQGEHVLTSFQLSGIGLKRKQFQHVHYFIRSSSRLGVKNKNTIRFHFVAEFILQNTSNTQSGAFLLGVITIVFSSVKSHLILM